MHPIYFNTEMYMNDLSDLEDILDSIHHDNDDDSESSYMDESDETDIINTCLQLMYTYIHDNPCAISEPDFEETMVDSVKEIFELQMSAELYAAYVDDLDELIAAALKLFYIQFIPPRSYPDTFIKAQSATDKARNASTISEKIALLQNKPQPNQRTPEWYTFRHNLITASNAYKAFENEATRNQLIYEKCQPLAIDKLESEKPSQININSPFHWGQKFEPVSVLFYEDTYKTTIGDFGCIQHDKYKFLGASPDGINIDPQNPRYGRLLEIKNIVNREIDGIPKKEYWIQMQLQMETCDLDECDFLECRFTEYENEEAFYSDGTFQYSEKDNCRKGVIMYFANKDGNPKYVYMPFHIQSKEEFDAWEEEMMGAHDIMWIKNIFWRLDECSCVLVLRNKMWFQDTIGYIAETWNIIEKERISGFQHRASAKRAKKQIVDAPATHGCFLSIIKKQQHENTSGDEKAASVPLDKPMLHIRTESFDETKKHGDSAIG